ncbi:hypothetical protein BJ138DRAFT_1019008 [Hygrophoropsis aurantiaca]|uniref:Uncharacterized protein n=1 Tax=Hygrophoropsis aurantiaca TaxID=72124 RepID=A0ACB7ZW11_9AGAM|nr:hypothetical protein BJ138DRAFT_1019008 [Hygrophoropsis aurantiaca]
MVADHGVAIDDIPFTAPPEDEGIDLSNDGDEHEMYDGLSQQIADLTGFRRVDPRVRRDRIELQNEHWGLQMDRLVAAYLDYRMCDSGDGMPVPSTLDTTTVGTECPALADMELVDLFCAF